MSYHQQWNLERIFSGGSHSPSLSRFLDELKAFFKQFEKSQSIQTKIALWQQITEQLSQADSFVNCLLAQNVHDEKAEQLESSLSELKALYERSRTQLEVSLLEMTPEEFQILLDTPEMIPIAFPLQRKRAQASEKLPFAQEALISDLAIDGYHGWSQLYNTLIGRVAVPFKDKAGTHLLSWGQAYNKLSDPSRAIRQQIFENSNQVWQEQQTVFGHVFNHISGFRLKNYQHHQWDLFKDSLTKNRMSQETLDTLWNVVAQNKQPFVNYLKSKAQLLGLDKLHWYDLEAPLKLDLGEESISYDEAAEFIISHFTSCSPQMGAFAKKAFREQWIEADDRPGKRPGGFCTPLPMNKESRIFMTYSNTKENLFTLAHELGHAYHNHVIFDLPPMARNYPMNLAETASTFAEMIISEAAFQKEKCANRKLWLLDVKLQRSISFLFNIHARFIFEKRVYTERKKGALSHAFLCEEMVNAQKEAYCDTLEDYNPYFWISKMHFNLTEFPFYNYPYTFGYLFSLGVYQRSIQEKDFEKRYNALLADTGRMTTEQLAKKHLGVDLTQEKFWQETLDFLKRDTELFELHNPTPCLTKNTRKTLCS